MAVKLSSQEALKLYKDMVLVRKFEEKCAQLYSMGHIAGFLHLYIGQEAIAAGFNFLKNPQDTHITSYRCHGHALLQGEMNPDAVMAELLGKATGSSKGKGGSMHIFAKNKGFYGGNGIVAAQIPLGAGAALYHKYMKDGGVNVAYMGDGALPQGQVYETFNMAALYKLPVVFVIENNMYSMGTPLDRTYANTELYNRGPVFNVPSSVINGMDVIEVIEGAKKALDHCREGKGPYLLEIRTYRYRGHSMSDPQKYRSKDEVDKYRNDNDPILNLEKYILDKNLAKEDALKEIQQQIKKTVAACEEFAINSPEPDPADLYTHILAS